MRLLRLFTTINDTICDVEGVYHVLVVDVTCTSHFVLDGLDEIAQASSKFLYQALTFDFEYRISNEFQMTNMCTSW
jgi:hypothetical protein